MKTRIIILLISITLILTLMGCSKTNRGRSEIDNISISTPMFVHIGTTELWYDEDTKIVYWDGYESTCPYLAENGKPYIYDESTATLKMID